jgi:hypothetical protein
MAGREAILVHVCCLNVHFSRQLSGESTCLYDSLFHPRMRQVSHGVHLSFELCTTTLERRQPCWQDANYVVPSVHTSSKMGNY